MRNIFFILSACATMVFATPSSHAAASHKAADTIIAQALADAAPVGSSRLTYVFWDVYDATLYAPKGIWHQNKPFALTLHYLRDLKGADIAKRSAEEIRKQGYTNEIQLAAWHAEMERVFPDVANGDTLTGLYTPGKATRFFDGEREIGVIHDPEFGKWFFDIWLSTNTSEPKMRRQLLGQIK